jgi:mRNA interferase MazF
MIRGEIWWTTLPDSAVSGSKPAKRRPVLIIQADSFNQSGIATVIVAAITSNTELSRVPGTLLLEKGVSGLKKTSVVNFSQITTLDKADLEQYVSMLPHNIIEKMEHCLKQVFGLD